MSEQTGFKYDQTTAKNESPRDPKTHPDGPETTKETPEAPPKSTPGEEPEFVEQTLEPPRGTPGGTIDASREWEPQNVDLLKG